MSYTEVETLRRAHQMFVGGSRLPLFGADAAHYGHLLQGSLDVGHGRYQLTAHQSREALLAAARTDAAIAAIIADAHRDREAAHQLTGTVLQQAHADAAVMPMTPMAQREALLRRVARLRAQRAHVLAARRQARRYLSALRALRYPTSHPRGAKSRRAPSDRAGIAVRAALSRLGRPYVWGATGPNQFDCSGLVQWAYERAGVHLDRTTYRQIHQGIPVARSHVRPGDLVFPHPGHVQLAIGNNLVVEAPYSGAAVRISRLGSNVQIRRPL
ncbi:NlpC/P60 family protein [Mycobacterium simiae]|uniref:NlpC/P60 family protein n=1 Tax=Mycobacterium simiae TaxID=1784 RepID=A0A5B1BM35_MYCSI|nr:C40 family peptidase [Mycobacterium simiae]KAA1248443.1 NlpC/P60 family protein [Mycobacterium simiae]